MVLAVFRRRLRRQALEAYGAEMAKVVEVARAIPGFVEARPLGLPR